MGHNISVTVNPLYNDTVCPQIIDVKMNFCCNEFKSKVSWYICANTIDVVKNFAVIKNVTIKSFHCIKVYFTKELQENYHLMVIFP